MLNTFMGDFLRLRHTFRHDFLMVKYTFRYDFSKMQIYIKIFYFNTDK